MWVLRSLNKVAITNQDPYDNRDLVDSDSSQLSRLHAQIGPVTKRIKIMKVYRLSGFHKANRIYIRLSPKAVTSIFQHISSTNMTYQNNVINMK
uniref:Uncharacterized protein n=1 Tax=Arundo donax TaxID=35708 RepID=A0A0A9HGQ7_ARUDO